MPVCSPVQFDHMSLTEYSPRFKELLKTHMQNKKLKALPNSSPTVQISWYHFRIHRFTDLSCIHMWHVCYSRAVHRQCRIISGVTIQGFSNSKQHSVLPRTRTLLTLLTFPHPPNYLPSRDHHCVLCSQESAFWSVSFFLCFTHNMFLT